MTTLTLEELAQADGLDLGASDWTTIDQRQIELFAEGTHDHQWIHVDPEMAAQGPFGTTVAHGYLQLALLPFLLSQVLSISDARMGINYGTEKVRFTAPVKSGAEVRVHATLVSSEPRGDGVLYRVAVQMEVRGEEKPSMVGEVVYLVF
ncbi:MAG TPA: MaoC family dehydratase [Gaiellaceae bacterium]|nr:MaoC family dehydratase [Gaiellaceae bacterium]